MGRKGQINRKTFMLEYAVKYCDIPYQDYCSKSEFVKLIEEIERLDRNDGERAVAAFRILRVDRFIDNKAKVRLLLDRFEPLLQQNKQNVQEALLKHIVVVRDRKYIEKLTR